jgi:hypothetical protein
MKRVVGTALVAGGLIVVGAIQSSGNQKMREASHGKLERAALTRAAIGLHPERKSARP